MATEKIKRVGKRTATLNSNIDVENRKVDLCFMTEKSCDNWWVPEVCLCNRENADLTRFDNGIAPVLFNHDRDKVIGKIEAITFENQRANATIVFDTDDEAEAVFKKVQSGSLRGVSVGYIRQATTRVDASDENPIEFMGRTYKECTDVTTLWELLEISIVSVPADSDTGVGRDLGDFEINVLSVEKEIAKEQKEMAEEIKDTVDVEAERSKAIKAERERTNTIMALCRAHNIETAKADAFITEGKSIEDVRCAILDIIAERQKPSSVEFGQDENEKLRAAIVSGMCLRHNVKEDKAAAGANNYRAMNIRGVAEEVLEREGVTGVRYMDGTHLFERAMGSGTFSGIMDEFVHKVMREDKKEQPFIWKNFCSTGVNTDFKPNYKYEMGLDGLPVLMAHESAEFKYQEMGDAKISTSVQTYGKAVKFTREIFINDQLGQVAKAISKQTGGFARLKEVMFFKTLAAVPFNAKNKNIVTGQTGINAAVYDAMAQLMMSQKDINGEGFVGVAPSYILAPMAQKMEHKTLLNSTAQIGQANPGVINAVQGDYTLFVSPYLTGDNYYAIANPAAMEGIEYTTLAGSNGVQSRIVIPQNYLGQEIQLWEDFSFNLIDPAAFVRAAAK